VAGVQLVIAIDSCVNGAQGSEVGSGVFGFKVEGVGLGGVLGKEPGAVSGLMWLAGLELSVIDTLGGFVTVIELLLLVLLGFG